MSKRRHELFDSGEATADLATGSVPYRDVAKPVFEAVGAAIAAADLTSIGEKGAAELLKAMRETHQSIVCLCLRAEALAKEGERTGQPWAYLRVNQPDFDRGWPSLRT